MYASEPNYFYTNNFEISEIIFDEESADVTLNGRFYIDSGGEATKCVFSCDFRILGDILMRTGENTTQIIDLITEKLNKDFIESPTVIDLNTIFDDDLWVSDVTLKLYKLQDGNENDEWDKRLDNVYVIDSIVSNEEKKKIKKKTETKLEDAQLLWDDYLQLLDNAMEYYIQLRQRGFEEEDAKQRTGLKDELLFRLGMAYNTIKNLQNGK